MSREAAESSFNGQGIPAGSNRTRTCSTQMPAAVVITDPPRNRDKFLA